MQPQDETSLQELDTQNADVPDPIEAYAGEPEPSPSFDPPPFSEPEPLPRKNPIDVVEHVEVGCEAILGQGKMTVGRLTELQAGDLIKLDRSPADPVDIRVNGRTIARGEIVTIDDRFAVRLTQIG